ncbi:HEPN/Toprim-associated domain-containing protein [Pseudomonas sp. IT-P218]|uniref:HEPN/Toprim-associated domain-containing protein n=1 Tax=Pseudomonas sp. IT-P218 TaxID=3026449 RepID=UPI0039E1C7EC
MSSWYDIKIQDHNVFENSSRHFEEWLFQKSDQVIREDELGTKEYLYLTDAATLKRRLTLRGCDRNMLEREFEEAIETLNLELEYAEEIIPAETAELRAAIHGMNLDFWLDKLQLIVENNMEPYLFDGQRIHNDPVIDYLLCVNRWPTETRYTSFPCMTPDGYAVAVLQFAAPDAEVVMNCTDLVRAQTTDVFDNYIEHLQEHTDLYKVFQTSTLEIENILHTTAENSTLAKLLYAGVITAMETYLSDTMRKLVLNHQAVMQRFVESSENFNKNMKISDIFNRLEKLEKEVSAELDKTSFHNLPEAAKLFQDVLIVDFPEDSTSSLKGCVHIRHDIVHRNGKTFKGIERNFKSDDVTSLINLVKNFLENIDNQIKTNLLIYEN